MERDYYLGLRRQFEPKLIKLVVVAESPPQGGTYFYNPEGSTTEHLFSALMKQLKYTPKDKKVGLLNFQERGWVLADATYRPVNGLTDEVRNQIILADYKLLRDDLKQMLAVRETPLILVKANICRLLEPLLIADRFKVINNGRPIYFPSHGRQNQFHEQFSTILASANISP
jgi:hypothetical protein